MEQVSVRSASGASIVATASMRPGEAAAGAVSGGRILWLDRAKGIGIILVVIGHAAGGLIDFRAMQPSSWLMQLFFAIYTFHMPLFFFLSALLIDQRVRKDKADFTRSLVERIVYPYFLWSVIQLTMIYLAATLVNTPLDGYWANVVAMPWAPVSQFWFLYALALLQLLSLALLPFMRPVLFFGVMAGLWLLAWMTPLPGPMGQAGQYAIYFGLGVAIGPQAGALIARLRGWPALVIAAVFIVGLLVAATVRLAPVLDGARPSAAMIASVAWEGDLVPLAFLGGLIVLILASAARRGIADRLSLLGRASMVIYLTHVILIAGTRILIARIFGPLDAAVMLPILITIGLGGPIVVQSIARRLSVARLLALQ